MTSAFERSRVLQRHVAGLATAIWFMAGSQCAAMPLGPGDDKAITPIKHVIIIIGENRSFDHVFGAYVPKPGQSVFNILSEGIIAKDGSPGRNFAKAQQYQARVTQSYDPAPTDKQPYSVLPPAMTDKTPTWPSDNRPPFTSLSLAAELDGGISAADLHLLLIGASSLPRNAIDTRLPNATSLPNGPYQLTPSIPYYAYAASPVHRFFQMWQQMDCSVRSATASNPSGCLADLFPWVETSVGAGGNGKPIPADFNDRTTGEGSTAMGFYNMNAGDAPYLKQLAEEFTISDNFHQAVQGGTGANHIMLGSGDAIWFSDREGHPAIPPADQIEDPNPQPGTNNYYTQDGYSGGSYVACADKSQPGVGPLLDYLAALPYKPKPNCETGHYYLVNNYSPGYFVNGAVNTQSAFVVPPAPLPTIGDLLIKANISFRYYGEGWNAYLRDPESRLYCDICNFLQYTPTIMTDAHLRYQHIRDITDIYNDIADDSLPAISFVKPSALNDGHPASSKLDLFEAFVRKIIELVRKEPEAWNSTAVFITFDEAGGYWDSGYVQPLDFFGDGPRIPLIVVSPYATGGRVIHTYADHVSFLKFIEKNWSLQTVSSRSRDNLPNPIPGSNSPYIPINAPAIGDLTDMFQF